MDLYWSDESKLKEYMTPGEDEQEILKKEAEYMNRLQIDYPKDLDISVDNKIFVKYEDLEDVNSRITGYELTDETIDPEKKVIQSTNLYKHLSKKLNNMKKIFISYSKYDKTFKDAFKTHTRTMQENELIYEPFEDEWISFGQEWDEKIKQEIDDCDIMVCLVSSDFLDTKYIRQVELRRAMDNNKILVPIIVRPCNWETTDFAKYQVAQKGECVGYKKEEDRERTKIEQDAVWVKIIGEIRKKLFLPE
jgi:hypothetical protein